jgi:sulfhydrogenase subunit beta (sulfur reductase)
MKDSSKSIKYVEKKTLQEFIKTLQKEYSVIAPRMVEGMVLFCELGDNEEPVMEFTNSRQSPKEVFFPQTESLMHYEGIIDTRKPKAEERNGKDRVILGMHPCDVASILILDKLFINEEYVDPYYKHLRDHTAIIAYGCNNPRSTCFCTSLGGGPFETKGADAFMSDVDDGYLIEAITDKGQAIIASLGDAPSEMAGRKQEIEKQANGVLKEKMDIASIPAKLHTIFEHEIWEEIAARCLGCGVCTFLCPTCHCFDIQDETIGQKGRRIKNWDSCMFPIFTLHGSGHQPREFRYQRMRQRIMHKFSYYVENFGIIACSGCGRCITECPVNIDVRETLKMIKEAK